MTGSIGGLRLTDSHRLLLRGFALAAAFSPVFGGLIRSLGEDPGHRHVLLPLLLTISLLVVGVPSRAPVLPGRAGVVLIVSGVLLELVGIATATSLIARIGLPLAVLGFSALSGRPDIRIAILTLGLVPIPDSVKTAASPTIEILIANGAARFWSLVGVPIEAAGPLLSSGAARLEISPGDSGLVTLVLLAEFGWYAAVRHGRDTAQALASSMRWALFAGVVQPGLVIACVGSLALGLPGPGRFVLSHGVPIGLAALVLLIHCGVGRATSTAHEAARLGNHGE